MFDATKLSGLYLTKELKLVLDFENNKGYSSVYPCQLASSWLSPTKHKRRGEMSNSSMIVSAYSWVCVEHDLRLLKNYKPRISSNRRTIGNNYIRIKEKLSFVRQKLF